MEEKKDDEAKNSQGDTTAEYDAPLDAYNITYVAFLFFGIGSLLPWNSVLTAIDFFQNRLTDYRPEFVFALVLNTPSFSFAFLNIFLSKSISLSVRLIVSFVGILLITIALPLVTELLPQPTAWPILILLI